MIFSAAILTWGGALRVVRAIRTAWKFRFGFSAECRTVEAMLHQFDELRKDENSAQTRQLKQFEVGERQRELYESRAHAGLVQCARPPKQ